MIAIATLLGSVAWYYGGQVARAVIAPSDEAMAEVARILEAEIDGRDAIIFVPGWASGQRIPFAKIWRKKGLDFSDSVVFGEPIDGWDLDGYRRLWVLASYGRGGQVESLDIGPRQRFEDLGSGLSLALYQLPPSSVVYDFRKHLSEAHVERIDSSQQSESCSWRTNRHECGGKWWRDVFQGVNEVGGTRRSCIFVQPHPTQGFVRLRWKQVASGAAIEGRIGNRLWGVRVAEGSDVLFRVLVDGQERYRQTLQRGDDAYHRWRIDIDPNVSSQTVEFEWSAADTRWRQTCFDAWVIGTRETTR